LPKFRSLLPGSTVYTACASGYCTCFTLIKHPERPECVVIDVIGNSKIDFYLAICYAQTMPSQYLCPSVRPYGCPSHASILFSASTLPFSPSGNHAILVFRATLWQYSDGEPLTGHQMQME